MEEGQARSGTEMKRNAGDQGADVDALPGPQHGEALPRVVRPPGALGVELAEQQRVVQLSVHLHAPCQQHGPDPAPTGVLRHGDRFDLRVRQQRQQDVLPAARQLGEP